jgi:hypothetical protein
MLHVNLMLHVRLHTARSSPYCRSMSMLHVRVHAMLYVHVNVRAACMYMSMMHVH